jgi:hypothetical protein
MWFRALYHEKKRCAMNAGGSKIEPGKDGNLLETCVMYLKEVLS